MPNHVANYIKIRGELSVLKKFWAKATRDSEGKKTDFNYSNLVPEPTSKKMDLYTWHCNNWGNKWGCYNVGFNKSPINIFNNVIKLNYDTALLKYM